MKIYMHRPSSSEVVSYNGKIFTKSGTLIWDHKTSETFYLRKLRSDSSLNDKIEKSYAVATTSTTIDTTIHKATEPILEVPSRVTVDKIMGLELFLDVPTSTYVVKNWKGEEFPATVDGFAEIISRLSTVKKLETNFASAIANVPKINFGSRVLLWGPTWTWKTYQFHALAKDLIDKWEVDIVDKVTVTDGFEDTDFLSYIHPNASGWLDIKEKSIVSTFREASKGKKVAVCIDELNRGSRSFMNFILTFIDGVDGEFYVLNNFLADEKILIPMRNVIFYATMNLWNKYSGTSALDEALMDRFSRVDYVSYNLDNEKLIMREGFGSEATTAFDITNFIRELHKSWEIRSSISTRWLKMWAEAYLNSPQSKIDIYNSFATSLLYRLINVDDYGNPNSEEIMLIMKKFQDMGIIEAPKQ